MSIYATLGTIGYCQDVLTDDFIEVWFQCVPGHIGHPMEGYSDGDPYADFLPPAVENPDNKRAVVVLQQGRMEQDGQRYTDPLFVLTGEEWERVGFSEMLERIGETVDPAIRADGVRLWERTSEGPFFDEMLAMLRRVRRTCHLSEDDKLGPDIDRLIARAEGREYVDPEEEDDDD